MGKMQIERMRKKEAEIAAHKERLRKQKEDRKKRQENLLKGRKRFGAKAATHAFIGQAKNNADDNQGWAMVIETPKEEGAGGGNVKDSDLDKALAMSLEEANKKQEATAMKDEKADKVTKQSSVKPKVSETETTQKIITQLSELRSKYLAEGPFVYEL